MIDSSDIMEEIEKCKELIGENRGKIDSIYDSSRKRLLRYILIFSIISWIIGLILGCLLGIRLNIYR